MNTSAGNARPENTSAGNARPENTSAGNARFTTSVDGTSIAWYDFGGNGPELLLGHATGFCAHVWKPVVDELRANFRCYAYDLRGHGSSSRPTGGRDSWNWHRYADDVLAVLAAAGLRQPFSVGHSCGAATALLVEERNPGTFPSLIGFEPVMFDDIPPKGPDETRELAARTRSRRTTFASRADALANFSTRGPFTKLHPLALEAYVDHGFELQAGGSIALRCRPEDEAEVYVMATAHDGFVNLDKVNSPVTVVHGEESQAFDESTMRAVAGRVQSGRFAPMSGVGHFGALEQPAEFVRLINEAFPDDVASPR